MADPTLTPDPDAEKLDAVKKVEEAFHNAHKTADRLVTDAAWLLQTYIKACRIVGVHPNESETVTGNLGDALQDATDAVSGLAWAHGAATRLKDDLIESGRLPGLIEPKDGGGGKKWP